MEVDWQEVMREENELLKRMSADSKAGRATELTRKTSTQAVLAHQALLKTERELADLRADLARLTGTTTTTTTTTTPGGGGGGGHHASPHADIEAVFGFSPAEGLVAVKEKVSGLKEKRRGLSHRLAHLNRLETTAVGAYVTFNNRVARDWCLDDYRTSGIWPCRLLQPYPLRLCSASGKVTRTNAHASDSDVVVCTCVPGHVHPSTSVGSFRAFCYDTLLLVGVVCLFVCLLFVCLVVLVMLALCCMICVRLVCAFGVCARVLARARACACACVCVCSDMRRISWYYPTLHRLVLVSFLAIRRILCVSSRRQHRRQCSSRTRRTRRGWRHTLGGQGGGWWRPCYY
jgi:hypothetical protein